MEENTLKILNHNVEKLELKTSTKEEIPQISIIIPDGQPKTFKEYFNKIYKERVEAQKEIKKQLKKSNK